MALRSREDSARPPPCAAETHQPLSALASGCRGRPLPSRGARLPHVGESSGRGSPRAGALRPLFCSLPPTPPGEPAAGGIKLSRGVGNKSHCPVRTDIHAGCLPTPGVNRNPRSKRRPAGYLSEELSGPSPAPTILAPKGTEPATAQPGPGRRAPLHSGTKSCRLKGNFHLLLHLVCAPLDTALGQVQRFESSHGKGNLIFTASDREIVTSCCGNKF